MENITTTTATNVTSNVTTNITSIISPNITSSTGADTTNRSLTIVSIVFYLLLGIAGAITNTRLITRLLRRKRKPSEYFILNLAFTDLMICIIATPLDIFELYLDDSWPYGGVPCKLVYPLQTLLVLSSILTLAAMSLERYRAIMTPFKPILRKSVLLVAIAIIWIIGFAAVAPYANTLNLVNGTCGESWSAEGVGNYYTLALFILDYGVPMTIITFCYSRAGYELHKNAKQFKRTTTINQVSISQTRALRTRHEKHKRTIKLFSFAVLVFLICTLPNDAYWMWASFGHDSSSFENSEYYLTFTNILVYSNSVVNPLIFGACK